MTRQRHPRFEPLEDRRMLSVAPLELDFDDPAERFDLKADTGAIHGTAYSDLNGNRGRSGRQQRRRRDLRSLRRRGRDVSRRVESLRSTGSQGR